MGVGLGPTFCFRKSVVEQGNAHLRRLLEPSVEALGFELLGIEYVPQGRNSILRVYIDSVDGITLDDCVRVSHQVSGVLDVEEPLAGQYQLEVSSPGLERPLFEPEQCARFVGERIRLRLARPIEGRRKITGVLDEVREDTLVVTAEEGRFEVAWEDVDKARLAPEL